MPTIAKSQTVLTHTDELVMRRGFHSRRGGAVERLVGLTHTIEAEAVEVVWVGEGGWVAGDAVGGDFECHAGWDDGAVGEVDWFEDFAVKGGLEGLGRERGEIIGVMGAYRKRAGGHGGSL